MFTAWKKLVPTFNLLLPFLATTFAAAQQPFALAEMPVDCPLTYEQELNSLLNIQSAWILPKQPQTVPIYQQDLQNLLQRKENPESSPKTSNVIELHEAASSVGQPTLVSESAISHPKTSALLPQETLPPKTAVLAAALEYISQPKEQERRKENIAAAVVPKYMSLGAMTEITITGSSTDPGRTAGKKMELPQNKAQKEHMIQQPVPRCYLAAGRGVWQAPRNTLRLCHNPLYFEDPNLERCGQGQGCLTTAHSALQFAAKAFLLPYMTAVQSPHSCVRALPDCPPCHKFGHEAMWPAWSWKGALAQGAAVTGATYVIP